jgi:hypothetical protein
MKNVDSVVIEAIETALGNAEDNAHRFKLSGQPSSVWEERRDLLRVALANAKKVSRG